MKNRLSILGRLFIAVLMASIVSRPLVVSANNGSLGPGSQVSFGAAEHPCSLGTPPSSHMLASGILLRSVTKETSNVEGWLPRISKSKAPSKMENHRVLVSAVRSFSPGHFLVLRI